MKKKIGEFLVEKGLLTPSQVDEVLEYSQRHSLRFGKAAMEMGLISLDQMIGLFGPKYMVDFFHLDARYFPSVTRDVLTPKEIIKYGAVPLGFKTGSRLFRSFKMLNMGFLNPGKTETIVEVERLAKRTLGEQAFRGLQIFLVISDQVLDVLHQVYGVDETALRLMNPQDVDETLRMFLEKPGH